MVDQEVFEAGRGDCLAACVASVLGLTRADVPNFADCGFFDGLREWLDSRGLRIISIRFQGSEDDALKRSWCDHFDDLVILWGDSPRFREDGSGRRKQHAVVGAPKGYGFLTVHDPHPSRDGLHGHPYGVMWIVPKR